MAPLLLFGYTGAAVVFLSALSFLIPVVVRPGAVPGGLVAAWLAVNAAAWALGTALRARHETSDTGGSLLALGDALLPLSACLVAASRGGAAAAASAPLALLMAASYVLLAALRTARARGLDAGYPFFLAGSGALIVHLARFTHGLRDQQVAGVLLALGLLLAEVFSRLARMQQRAFRLAALGVVVLAAAIAGRGFLVQPSAGALVALGACVVVLVYWALGSRDLDADCRLFGFGAYAAATLLLNACLREAGLSFSATMAANTIWVLALAQAGIGLRSQAVEPFEESAHWMSFLLALGLSAVTSPSWWPFRAQPGADFLPVTPAAAAASLVGLGAALAMMAGWRRRYPPIAFSVAGLGANLTLLNVSAYLAPLLVLIGAIGLWTQAIGTFEGAAFVGLMLGALYLAAAEAAGRLYPPTALRVAGYAAIVCAGVIASGQRSLAVVVWLLGAAVFLWRSLDERRLAPHVAFLACLAAAAVGVSRDAGGHTLGLAAVSVVALGVYRILSLREGPNDRANLTLMSAAIGAAAAITLALFYRPDLGLVVLVLWAVFPLLLAGERDRNGRTAYDEPVFMRDWAETGGWALAHAAGAAWLMLLWRRWGFPWGDAGLLLAIWAWIHSAAHRRFAARAPGRPRTTATGAAALALVAASLLLPVFSSSRVVFVAAVLINATLSFSVALRSPSSLAAARWRWLGTGLTVLAIVAAVSTSLPLTVAALAAAALLFLWRSFMERSLWTHVGFLGLAVAAAVTGARLGPGPADLRPVTLLSVGLLAVGHGLMERESRNLRVRVTLATAVAAGWAAVLFAAARGHLSPFDLAVVWLGFLAGMAVWERRPEEVDGRPDPPEDRWLSLWGLWLAHLAGALGVVVIALQGDAGRGGAALALAAWAALHAAATRRPHASGTEPAALASARVAVHAFAALALVLAWTPGHPQAAGIVACLGVAGIYVGLRQGWRWRWLEHAAAVAAVEATWLAGRLWQVTLPEYYLAPIGAYLYLVVHLDRVWDARAPRSAASPSRTPFGITRADVLGVIVLLLTVVYPSVELVRSLREEHLYALGAATVVLFYGFVLRQGSARLARTACVFFVAGALYLFARAEPSPALTAFLAAAGLLVLMGRSAPYILRMREYRT